MRTLRESLEKIVETGRAGKLGAKTKGVCAYRDENGNTCGIGCLLSRELLTFLEKESMLHVKVTRLEAKSLLVPGDYGLTIKQASAIQRWHDAACHTHYRDTRYDLPEFLEVIQGILDGEITAISLSPFEANGRVSFKVG